MTMYCGINCLILEGPDGSGKSTLSKELGDYVEQQGVVVDRVHHGPYKGDDNPAVAYFKSLVPVVLKKTALMVMDRSWLSEPIYGEVFRGGADRVGTARRRVLERTALGVNTIVIRCLPPVEVCLGTFLARRSEEMLDSMHQLREVHERYRTMKTDLPVIDYDYTVHNLHDLFGRLNTVMNPLNKGPGSGSWIPGKSILMVGDRPNTAKHGSLKFKLPFTSFHNGGCSLWLADQLESINISENLLYWVNSADCHGEPLSPEFLSELKPQGTIALGNEAALWCHRQKIPHYIVKHPMAHKRFHHNKTYELLPLLKEMTS